MKLLNVVCYYVAVIMTSGWLVQHPQAKITLRVVNQNEKPVTDTEITASFENGKADIRKKPDENGYVTFSSPVMGSAIFSNALFVK